GLAVVEDGHCALGGEFAVLDRLLEVGAVGALGEVLGELGGVVFLAGAVLAFEGAGDLLMETEAAGRDHLFVDRKSTRLNSSHVFPYTTLFRSRPRRSRRRTLRAGRRVRRTRPPSGGRRGRCSGRSARRARRRGLPCGRRTGLRGRGRPPDGDGGGGARSSLR